MDTVNLHVAVAGVALHSFRVVSLPQILKYLTV